MCMISGDNSYNIYFSDWESSVICGVKTSNLSNFKETNSSSSLYVGSLFYILSRGGGFKKGSGINEDKGKEHGHKCAIFFALCLPA